MSAEAFKPDNGGYFASLDSQQGRSFGKKRRAGTHLRIQRGARIEVPEQERKSASRRRAAPERGLNRRSRLKGRATLVSTSRCGVFSPSSLVQPAPGETPGPLTSDHKTRPEQGT